MAYCVLKKEKSGGLFVLRKITVRGVVIEKIEDDVEDLFSIKAAKLADLLEP